jgi:hypothetical protein
MARAQEYTSEEPSKEELQRRLDDARGSITNTVSEIKETVANQVQAVKDTLDWREQFKKRPVAWSAAALGVGFWTGYCIAGLAKGDRTDYHSAIDRYGEESRHYASQGFTSQGLMSSAAMATPSGGMHARQGNGTEDLHDSGPNFFKKIANTQAFERVKDEAGNIGDALVKEISNTAKTVVLPALITSLRNFIGDRLPNAEKRTDQRTPGYQPSLERNPT